MRSLTLTILWNEPLSPLLFAHIIEGFHKNLTLMKSFPKTQKNYSAQNQEFWASHLKFSSLYLLTFFIIILPPLVLFLFIDKLVSRGEKINRNFLSRLLLNNCELFYSGNRAIIYEFFQLPKSCNKVNIKIRRNPIYWSTYLHYTKLECKIALYKI